MFRVVRPLYPTAGVPSRIKNTKYTLRANSTKYYAPTIHYWQEQQKGTASLSPIQEWMSLYTETHWQEKN